jgi:hypothetical protein
MTLCLVRPRYYFGFARLQISLSQQPCPNVPNVVSRGQSKVIEPVKRKSASGLIAGLKKKKDLKEQESLPDKVPFQIVTFLPAKAN